MKTRPAYFVIDTTARKGPTISRVSQTWPTLAPDEVVVLMALEVPDALIPQAHVVRVEDPEAVAVAVLAQPLEVPA